MWQYTLLILSLAILLRCSDARRLRFNALRRCTMRGWGEPHIETCNDNGDDTICYAPGLQTYLEIFFLRVTVIHTVWRPDVTVITEVLVDFKSLTHPHAVTYTYKASNGLVPIDYEYKAASISAIDTVILNHMGNTVELTWPFAGVIIIIDNWGNQIYQVTMRGPQAIMNTGTGILIQGCPPDQITDGGDRARGGVRRRKRQDEVTEAEAKAACSEYKVQADTSDMGACIFDVITTGDVKIAGAAAMAIADRDMVVNSDDEMRRSAGVWPVDDDYDCDRGRVRERDRDGKKGKRAEKVKP